MRINFKKILNSNLFHLHVIGIIILIILVTTGLIVLRYAVEGESVMPYEIEKISIISSSEGTEMEEKGENKWSYNISQVNDVYIYIKENEEINDKLRVIEAVEISEFKYTTYSNEEIIKIYTPDKDDVAKTFVNKEENISSQIIFNGDYESNIKELKIGYQGGMVGFRCSNEDIGNFFSNEEAVNHLEFLKGLEINEEILKIALSFDLKIKLKEGVSYVGNIEINLPVGDIIEEGITSIERTDIDSAIFKRQK